MRVIVTRPKQEARQWVDALTSHGYAAMALPLIDVLPAPDHSAIVSAWDRLPTFDAAMFVSGNAVDYFFEQKPPSALVFVENGAIKTRAFVTGPGSLSALKRAQVDDAFIDMPDQQTGQFDSEALWSVVSHRVHAGYRVLVVRGYGSASVADAGGQGDGRNWFADQVCQVGGTVEFVAAYQRRAPQLDDLQRATVHQAAVDGSVWLFSSSEAIANLVAACPEQSWAQARAVVTHARIAQAARNAGFNVVCESRPSLAALMASIESIA